MPLVVTGSCIIQHDLFYGQDVGTQARRTACSFAENFPQILGKFETKRFAMDLFHIGMILVTL
ncbi:hypothetical protein EB232_26980 [Mesorhizobium sp. NZP2077]|nr:hypothetical protein EB232_26980 [Mesorhizobium sp. NZP2077]